MKNRVECPPTLAVLREDLPVADVHGARAGRRIAVVAVYYELGRVSKFGRADKYEFVGDAGESVCAFPREVEFPDGPPARPKE